MCNPFADAPIIAAYTRAQALADGVLIDVSDTARYVGFTVPVAMTAALQADIWAIPERLIAISDAAGRLWDVLWMSACEARRGGESPAHVTLIMPVGDRYFFNVTMMLGPGDAGEPVITLMLPHES